MYGLNNDNLDTKENYMFYGAIDKTIRDMFFKDLDKAIVLISIIFNTNFQDQYKDLQNLQSYFSYSVFEKKLNFSKSKLQRIIKVLEEEGFIEWVIKSQSRHKASIITLNYQYGKGYGRKYSKQYGKDIDITNNTVKFNTVKNTVNHTVKDTLSKNISKNISKKNKEETTKIINLNTNILNSYKYHIDSNITPFIRDELRRLENQYGNEILEKSIEETAKRNMKSLNYIVTILEDWQEKGLKTIDDIEMSIEKWKLNNKKCKDNHEKYITRKSDKNTYDKKAREYEKPKLRFNNFKGRDYDYDALERKLLGWDED